MITILDFGNISYQREKSEPLQSGGTIFKPFDLFVEALYLNL